MSYTFQRLAPSIALILALAIGGGGCSKKRDRELQTVNTSQVIERQQRKKRLLAVRNRVIRELRALKNLELNRENYRRSGAKARRMSDALSMFVLIPIASNLPRFKARLEAQLRGSKLKLVRFTADRPSQPKRQLPASFVGRRAFPFRPGDLVGHLRVTFEVDEASPDAIRSFFEARLKLERLILVDSIRHLEGKRFAIRAQLFFFFPFKAPKHELPLLDVSKMLRDANLGTSLRALASDPSLQSLVAEIESELREYPARRRKASQSLSILSEGHLLEARWSAFRALSVRHDGQLFAKIYRGPAPTKRRFGHHRTDPHLRRGSKLTPTPKPKPAPKLGPTK
ncbi:MAG: hypothetical protein KC609_00230 [Myxococcales bacterium]|nr:hypothetical protein [Myxococcales bacterium]